MAGKWSFVESDVLFSADIHQNRGPRGTFGSVRIFRNYFFIDWGNEIGTCWFISVIQFKM